MSRRLLSIALTVVLLSSLFAGLAIAGSIDDPELEDTSQDSDDAFRDIVKVWVDGEDNGSVRFNLQLFGEAPPWQRGYIVSGLPVYDYEIYFTCMGRNYSVVREVQVAISSPIAIVIGDAYLKLVEYDNETGELSSESNGTTINSDFDEDTNSLYFNVQKGAIGGPEIGKKITHLWAAVWNVNENPADSPRALTDAVDVAGSYGNPGTDYMFTGGFQYLYRLVISVDRLNATVAPGGSATYIVTVNATSENPNGSVVEVVYSTGSNWTVTVESGSRTVRGSETYDVTLLVKARDVSLNGSKASVVIYANLYVEEGTRNGTLTSEQVLVTTTVIVPSPQDNPESGFEKILKMLMQNMMIIGVIVAMVIVVIIVYAFVSKKDGA